ncbi:preprotein translocase subunit YajC [Candidatus Dependentiae bacterium]
MNIYQNPTIAMILKLFAQFLPFILIIGIFYFFLIRPQQKQQQSLNLMRDELKKGNKVITKGGILGTVENILENTIIITLHDGSKIEILKSAVISLINVHK